MIPARHKEGKDKVSVGINRKRPEIPEEVKRY